MSLIAYFDHNATTPVHPEVIEKLPVWAHFSGNPSSIHKASREPKALIRETRKSLAEAMNAHPLEFIFTSGGSESNNHAIKGVFYSAKKLGRTHFVTSMVEHPSVLKTFEFLKTQGATVDYIPVDIDGNLDLDFYEKVLTEKTALVSVMLANNETGVIHPIKKMAEMAHAKGAYFHTDAVQALGKIPVDLADLGVDLASFSAHKFYSLKGAGILFQKRGVSLENLVHGGGQERGRRAGTENVLAIASLGYMLGKRTQILEQSQRVQHMRDDMEAAILAEIPNVKILCKNSLRLPNTSSMVFEGVDGETLLMNLDMHGICVSTGAACSSGSQEPSPVLRAMGLSRQDAQASLRVTLGWLNKAEQVDYFLETLKKVVGRIRQFNNTQIHEQAL